MPTGAATVLRLIRVTPLPDQAVPRVIGVDDWAKRNGRSYSTIIVDLEQHRVVDLLPDRTAATLAGWLRQRPRIEVVARDRSTEYASGSAIDALAAGPGRGPVASAGQPAPGPSSAGLSACMIVYGGCQLFKALSACCRPDAADHFHAAHRTDRSAWTTVRGASCSMMRCDAGTAQASRSSPSHAP